MPRLIRLLSVLLLLSQLGPLAGAVVCAGDLRGNHEHCSEPAVPASDRAVTPVSGAVQHCMDSAVCQPGAAGLPSFVWRPVSAPPPESRPLPSPRPLQAGELPAPIPPPPNA